MLVLTRREGQWIEIRTPSGDMLRIRLYHIRHGHTKMAFDGPADKFMIVRPEAVGDRHPTLKD